VLNQSGEVDWCNPAAGELLGVDWPRDHGIELVNLVRHPDLRNGLEELKEGFQYLRITSPLDDRSLELSMLPYGKKHLRLILVRDLTLPGITPTVLSEEWHLSVEAEEVRVH
jgi:two-component system phosphate regulon sensor histidine kinase PhoR